MPSTEIIIYIIQVRAMLEHHFIADNIKLYLVVFGVNNYDFDVVI